MNDMHWVYWAVTIPATIVIVGAWQLWIAFNDPILNFLETCWKRPVNWWVRATARKEKKEVAKA